MISRYTHHGLSWIDLESPTKEEIVALADEHNLHPLIASELYNPTERARVDIYENASYFILHFPVRNRTTSLIEEVEVDFVLMENVLITTHYVLVDPLHDFAKLFEAQSLLSKSAPSAPRAGLLFFMAIRELYKHTHYLLEGVAKDIRSIENHIFAGEESAMVNRISRSNRVLIDIRQAMRYHKETLKSFEHSCKHFCSTDYQYYANSIEGEYEHIDRLLLECRDTLRDLRETNDSLLTTKTNAIIRKLTVVNIVLLPLGLVTWIFAMESQFLSLDDPKALIAVFAGMGIIALSSVLYFKSRKWL